MITEDDYVNVTKYYALDFAQIEAKDENDMRICAKQVIPDPNAPIQRIKYYVRFNELTGRIYNPTENMVDAKTRGAQAQHYWAYRRVNQVCFDHYLKFLATRNKVWLQQSEREVVNGYR